MSIYTKLSLGAGGGIISEKQQAEQSKSTATVLVGLGGTGMDAVRTIKTQVFSRLKPDDPKAVVARYQHIRFLGVDTDEKSRGDAAGQKKDANVKADALRALDDSEYFSIANPRIKDALGNKQSLELKDEFSWLNWEEIPTPDFGKAGAGGIRQVGRYMMMDRSKDFMDRIEKEITEAKKGLTNPAVNVHIFSGLSGGTGAGCFLDVCYMVRHIANKVGGVTLFGYFYLPDVNLSVIPFSDNKTRSYVPKNGYASMQELDYCMQLQYNGGSFIQEYQNNTLIEWKEPPVDMCHLVCATDANNNVIDGAYDYAMNVTAEYVMDFLTHSTAKFGLAAQLANFRQKVRQGDSEKPFGANLSYCVIGASCASIPMREINTYLASELFHKFSKICKNTPTKVDVENLALDALAPGAQNASEIYGFLYREMCEGFEINYAMYDQDWRYVLQYGNSDMVTHYKDQNAMKLNKAVANTTGMITPENEKSLIYRIRSILAKVIRNIDFGPMFAYGMLAAAQHNNLLNIIDGLIEENDQKWDQERAQSTLRQNDYESMRSCFENRTNRFFLDNDRKRFNDYDWYMRLLVQHQLELELYANLDNILTTLRKQVVDATAAYYLKLNRVMNNLVDTFRENRDALASEKLLQSTGSFVIPMMTIADLKDTLDEEIKNLNVPGLLDAFMEMFLTKDKNTNEPFWITEEENKISRQVNDFFVNTAFNGFANRTITAFLKDKYKVTSDEELTELVYDEWMTRLTSKASPLFSFDGALWKASQTAQLAFISIPEAAVAISKAADMMHDADEKWSKKESALTDRIYIMCSACALPLCAYRNGQQFERMYFQAIESGAHYYEGKPAIDMVFSEWRHLPSLIPLSHMNLKTALPNLLNLVEPAVALYDEALSFGVINDSNKLCVPDPQGSAKLQQLIATAEGQLDKILRPADVAGAKELMAKIQAARKIPMVATDRIMKNDGNGAKVEVKQRVQKDYFIAAPAYQILAEKTLAGMRTDDAAAAAMIQKLQTKIDDIEIRGRGAEDFCDALFSGVIKQEGRKIYYTKTEYGIVTEVVLSMRSAEFPFNAIPPYQAYRSYESLLDSETKAAIKAEVDALYNADDPQLILTGQKLKTELADNKVQAWQMAADTKVERAEILNFIINMKKRFNMFCMENGIA